MKTARLLKKSEEILNAKKSKQHKEKACLKEVLSGLKKKKRKLVAKLEDSKSSSDQRRIRKELAIIHVRRKKGLKILKTLD